MVEAQVQKSEIKLTGDETIGDVLKKHPKAAGVFLKYGLHCVGCHVNQFESIRQGVQGHGMPEGVFDQMMEETNALLNKKIETIEITPAASEMMKAYALEDGKEGWALKVGVTPDFQYEMEFVEHPEDGDEQFEMEGVRVFVDKDSYPRLKGSEIDFVETITESGFRIDNPNAPKKSGCGCGKSEGGCGCGSGNGSGGGCGCH